MFRKAVFLIIAIVITKAGAQTPALVVADSLYAVGEYTKAIQVYKEDTSSTKSQLQIARSYRAIGNGGKALAAYLKVVQDFPKQTIAKTEYAKLLITNRKFKAADSILEQLITQYPENPDYHYQQGRALAYLPPQPKIRDGDTLRYEKHHAFAKAYTLDPTHQKAGYEYGKHLLLIGEYPDAIAIASKALQDDPENIEMINLLAQTYQSRGSYNSAIPWWERLIELGQSNERIHAKLGKAYDKDKRTEEAIAQYLKVFDANRLEIDNIYALTKAYGTLGNYKKAEEFGQMAANLLDQPQDFTYFLIVEAMIKRDQWEKAMHYVNKTLKENPNFQKAQYTKAVIADNYYKERKQVMELYLDFINKNLEKEDFTSTYFKKLATERVNAIREEIFLNKK